MDNAAQHFPGRASSGLYEDRDEDAVRGGCYCKPLNLPGSYEDPRSRVLYHALAALAAAERKAEEHDYPLALTDDGEANCYPDALTRKALSFETLCSG